MGDQVVPGGGVPNSPVPGASAPSGPAPAPASTPAQRVTPRLFRGLRDYLPDQMAARQRMIDTIRGVYESYGFVPLGTPAIEHIDVLVGAGGAEANKSIFRVQNIDDDVDRPEMRLGLRFDLTVPLARVISQYPELPKPFRRYQVSPVWRADKPDKGRYREFTQFDIDSVGAESDLADMEIMAAMCDTLSALDVGPYRVKFSSRKVLELLLKYAEVPSVLKVGHTGGTQFEDRPPSDVFRVLDKLDKIGPEKVRLELTTGYKDESGDRIPGLGLSSGQVDRIEQFLAIRGETRTSVLEQTQALFAGIDGAEAAIGVLRRISDELGSLGYGDDRLAVDLSIARGLAYYTGTVFEAGLLDAPQFGSVFAGGRYDDLVMRFHGERLPAVGASIGVDRLLAALVELGRVKLRKATAKVLVTTMDAGLRSDYVAMAFELRRAGIPTELFLGEGRFKKQVKHADVQDIPVTVVVGGDEHARGVVIIKEMSEGRKVASQTASRTEWLQTRPGQTEVPRKDLVAAVKSVLASVGE